MKSQPPVLGALLRRGMVRLSPRLAIFMIATQVFPRQCCAVQPEHVQICGRRLPAGWRWVKHGTPPTVARRRLTPADGGRSSQIDRFPSETSAHHRVQARKSDDRAYPLLHSRARASSCKLVKVNDSTVLADTISGPLRSASLGNSDPTSR